MITKLPVVGIYGDITAANNNDLLDRLQGEIGLNRIVMGAAYNISPHVRALNPIPPEKGSFGPGMQLTEDDGALHRALENAHRRGIKVYGCVMIYWCMADLAPQYMVHDLAGHRMDEFPKLPYAHEQGAGTWCPNSEPVNAWFDAALTEVAVKYDFDGYALTHARYAHPAFFQQLWGCGCPVCEAAARARGYDFDRMKKAALGLVDNLQHLTARQVQRAASLGCGFMDFLQLLSHDAAGVADWFDFRADSITRSVSRFRASVKKAVQRDFCFGTDTYYPTFALLAGQRYQDFASCRDQILPLVRHIGIHCLDNMITYAQLLTQWVNGLSEQDALQLVYRLFGYDRFAMPKDIASAQLDDPYFKAEPALGSAMEDIVTSEIYKARLMSGDSIPSYPVIAGDHWPLPMVRRLVSAIEDAGHNGVYFMGTSALIPEKKA